MRKFGFLAALIILVTPAAAGDWGGAITTRTVYNDFHIYYDDRSSGAGSSAGIQATFQDIAFTGSYRFGNNAISVQIAEGSDPDFDNFWGGNGNWDANGIPCTAASCRQTAERSDFNLTYTRQLENGWSVYTGIQSGSVSWKEVQGRAHREAAGNSMSVANICEVDGASVETTTKFENENFGVFIGGAYSRAFSDRVFGTVRLAAVLDGEADVSETYSCANGAASVIGDNGTLFEGIASSLGLSLFYSVNENYGINFAFDSKSFSYDDGTDYWSGGSARTEESLDVLSLGYVFSF
jgi:hypothetical protein